MPVYEIKVLSNGMTAHHTAEGMCHAAEWFLDCQFNDEAATGTLRVKDNTTGKFEFFTYFRTGVMIFDNDLKLIRSEKQIEQLNQKYFKKEVEKKESGQLAYETWCNANQNPHHGNWCVLSSNMKEQWVRFEKAYEPSGD